MKPSHLILLTVALLLVIAAIFVAVNRSDGGGNGSSRVDLKLHMRGSVTTPDLVRLEDGSYRYVITRAGREELLTPQEFSKILFDEEISGTWWNRLFNISTPLGMLWVSIGLLGQLLFSGRMVVQWLASEKAKRSVVPAAFWWMSLVGATMLLVYFLWRRDLVGVLGQGTGWMIYGRNLWLIYRRRHAEPSGAALSPSVATLHESRAS